MSRSPATIFVCTSCRRPINGADGSSEEDCYDEPGPALLERLKDLTATDPGITVAPVDCLAVCTRACTVALTSNGKWTYVIGNVDPDLHAQEVANAARAFAVSENGIVPWRERPKVFRKGVIARIPPIISQPSQESS